MEHLDWIKSQPHALHLWIPTTFQLSTYHRLYRLDIRIELFFPLL